MASSMHNINQCFEAQVSSPLLAPENRNAIILIGIAAIQTAIYGVIAWLSTAFAYGTDEVARPILAVFALFTVSFVLYLVAIRAAVRCQTTRRLGWAIIAPAILFRCLLLPTPPIQEVDIYRYLWDGAVSARGLSPYRFAPAQILTAGSDDDLTEELRSLTKLRDSSPAISEVLRRIHYADLTTIYPPVAQAVFAVGDWLTPQDASVSTRVIILKTVLTTFDIGTLALLWLLLRAVGKHPGWVVTYAWCPLVIKEFANTGHFDSVSVFLATAAVYFIARLLALDRGESGTSILVTGAVLLALAIGVKLYPIVLIPVLCAAVVARSGVARAAVFVSVTALLSIACLAPMLLTRPASVGTHASLPQEKTGLSAGTSIESNSLNDRGAVPTSSSGLKAFVTRWEMNDFLFMQLVENLRPAAHGLQSPTVWFAVTPSSWREGVTIPFAAALGIDVATAAFLLTRIATTCVFLVIAFILAWRVYRCPNRTMLVEAVVLTLAWFWLLSPTQNPWYWIWAMPFLPFARGRAWYAMSGLVMLYYLRFWFRYQFPNGPVLGIAYGGDQFFDFVVTWFEYAPWFIALTVATFWRRWQHRGIQE